jgi:hypothetical protein
MASNSISSNPVIIDEIYNATILRHPPLGGGITSLSNTDTNVSVSVNGTNGQINLESTISVTTLKISDKININGNTGISGQVLTSQGSGAVIWSDNIDSGITSLTNTDSNVSVSVVGSTGTVNLEQNIDISGLTIEDFKNPWTLNQPSVNGQVLSSDTNGDLSWTTPVDNGITSLSNTDSNVSVSVLGNAGTVNLEQNIDISGLTITGGQIEMKGNNINSAHWFSNKNTDPQTSIDIFTNWDDVNNTWGGEIYLDNTGVYLSNVQETHNLIYNDNGDLSNYGTVDAFPPITTPANWSITSAGDAQLKSLELVDFINPWTGNQPSVNGQVLSSDTNGDLSWVSQASPALYTTIYYNADYIGAIPSTNVINVFNNTITNFTIGKKCVFYINCSVYTPAIVSTWYPLVLTLFVDGNSTAEQQVQTPNANLLHNSLNATYIFTPTATSHSIAINVTQNVGFMPIETDGNDITVLTIDELV